VNRHRVGPNVFSKFFSRFVLRYDLRNSSHSAAFVLTVMVIAIAFVGSAIYLGIVESWADSSQSDQVRKAAALDPKNPAIQYRVGMLYTSAELSPDRGLPYLRQAVAINPQRAQYWSGLGLACFATGDLECAHLGFGEAVRLSPMVPLYRAQLANYDIAVGDRAHASADLGRYLQLALPLGYLDPVPSFRSYLRAFNTPDDLWRILGSVRDLEQLKAGYINFLADDQPGLASSYWHDLVAGGPIALPEAKLYVQKLLAAGEYGNAAQAWRDLQHRQLIAAGSGDRANFNGDFEHRPLNFGFDWQYQPNPYIDVGFSDSSTCRSGHCLRVEYTVADNADAEPVYQLVAVEPNRVYSLTAFVRSSDITSDSGPRLRVVDPQCSSCAETATAGTVGTTQWHELNVDFTTGPASKVVRLSVWRPRSRTFPMEISGKFWLDSVSLRSAPVAQDQQRATNPSSSRQ